MTEMALASLRESWAKRGLGGLIDGLWLPDVAYADDVVHALGGLVMQVWFEHFSFNELQSSVLGHSFRTCIVLALRCRTFKMVM